MDRREFTLALSSIKLLFVGATGLFAQTEETVAIEWRILPDQLGLIPTDAPLQEGEPADTRSPLLVGAIVLVGAWAVPKIAQAVLDVYYRYQGGGVVIDVRSSPVVVETNPRIPPGFVLVISEDGAETVSLGGVDPMDVEDLTEFISNSAN